MLRLPVSDAGFIGPNWALAYESVLWIALLYNVYSFAAVNALIRAALRTGTADMDPQARRELEARVRLWPRFMLYVGSFIGSQAPCALRTIFDVADAPASAASSSDSAAPHEPSIVVMPNAM